MRPHYEVTVMANIMVAEAGNTRSKGISSHGLLENIPSSDTKGLDEHECILKWSLYHFSIKYMYMYNQYSSKLGGSMSSHYSGLCFDGG